MKQSAPLNRGAMTISLDPKQKLPGKTEHPAITDNGAIINIPRASPLAIP